MTKRNEAAEAVRAPTEESLDESKLSDRELLADLRRVARRTTSVSQREYRARGKFGVTTFRRRFGSWNAAKRQAGLQTRTSDRIDDERLLDDIRRVDRSVDGRITERVYADRGEFGVTTLRRRFGSWSVAKRRAGVETELSERMTEAICDDVARVADEVEAAYVTPGTYADQGTYPLSVLPTDEAFWDELRDRVGLSITPLYHGVAVDEGCE